MHLLTIEETVTEKSTELSWFALYTKPRAEKKLAAQFEEQGKSFYLPTFTEIRQWSDRKKKVTEPLIKRIIFVQTEPNKINDYFDYPLVTGVVRNFGKPAIIRQSEIDILKLIVNEWNGINISITENITFEIGQDIEITRGPFKGLTGKLVALKGKNRVVIQLQSLQVQFAIDIPKSYLKKIA